LSARWLILADDLTGAADAAVAFAGRGLAIEVALNAGTSGVDAEVLAMDLDTRGASAADAAARHFAAVRDSLLPGQALFKKIDSTLRGEPAAEIAAIADALRKLGRPSWALLAPANPAMGRTTLGGRVFVNGQPLESTETWRREHSYADSDLASIAGSTGLQTIKLPLAAVRGDEGAVRAALASADLAGQDRASVLICDAETEDDLRRIVVAAREVAPGFFAGTAGLARALSAQTRAGRHDRTTLAASQRGTLVAVGTLARVSRDAALRVAARGGGRLVRVDPAAGVAEACANEVATCLRRGETVVALLDAAEAAAGMVDRGHACYLAQILSAGLREMGALIVTGGETAAALLARCKVHGIRLLDEMEPGIALGMTRGGIEVPIITKPGAFGDEDSISRCLETLDRLRRTA
jgi:uncharacterized protein YgbK (DUF1537 family)